MEWQNYESIFYQLLLLLFEFQSGGIANVALFNKLIDGMLESL